MTALAKLSPTCAVPSVFGPLNRRFLDPFSLFETQPLVGTTGPAVIVYETTEEFVVQAELPGWSRDQVSVDFENQTLSIKGNRDLPNGDGRKYHRVEGFFGQFHRTFTLPNSIDPASVKAEMRDGVLTIRLPKKETSRSRQITIENA